MKTRLAFRIFALVAILALLLAAAPAPHARTLSRSGAPVPRVAMRAHAAPTYTLINDGGFEFGPPPRSAWKVVSNQRGCPPSSWILDPWPVWGVGAYEGTYAFWGGGYCSNPNSDAGRQLNIPVPVSGNTLFFYANYYRPDADDADLDTFTVKVNGSVVFTKNLVQANDTYPNWTLESINLSAYAGQNVSIILMGRSRGDLTGNVLVDAIGFGN